MSTTPFSDSIVTDPRRIEPSVPGLNEEPLAQVLGLFDALCAAKLPRPRATGHRAVLVGSPSAGYGKSHFIGRLFAAIAGRGFGVYIRPFEDPARPWHSILLMTIRDLLRPAEPGALPPLDGFARRVLGRLMGLFITEIGADAEEIVSAARHLCAAPERLLEHPEDGARWREWFAGNFAEVGVHLPGVLARHGVDLDGREAAWMTSLFTCGFLSEDGAHDLHRRVALKWMRAETLDETEAALLGITAADNEARGEDGAVQANDLARRRFRDLLELAAFDRPFLVCFDQTEAYARSGALASALGSVIERLVAEVPNQITVVTVNQQQWIERVAGAMEPPYRDRFSRIHLLEGTDARRGRSLIEARLAAARTPEAEAAAFLKRGWLEAFFERNPRRPPRELLRLAEEEWRAFRALPSAPEAGTAALFEKALAEVRAELGGAPPPFDTDDLVWLIRVLGPAGKGEVIVVEGNSHFSTAWNLGARRVYLALEPGDQHHRWRAIAAEARRLIAAAHEQDCRCVVLRTSDLPEIPKPGWKTAADEIREAMREGLSIFTLEVSQVEALKAARRLYLKTFEGESPAPREELEGWLRESFARLLSSLAGPEPAEGKTPAAAQTVAQAAAEPPRNAPPRVIESEPPAPQARETETVPQTPPQAESPAPAAPALAKAPPAASAPEKEKAAFASAAPPDAAPPVSPQPAAGAPVSPQSPAAAPPAPAGGHMAAEGKAAAPQSAAQAAPERKSSVLVRRTFVPKNTARVTDLPVAARAPAPAEKQPGEAPVQKTEPAPPANAHAGPQPKRDGEASAAGPLTPAETQPIPAAGEPAAKPASPEQHVSPPQVSEPVKTAEPAESKPAPVPRAVPPPRVAEPVKTVRMTEAELAEPKPAPVPKAVPPPPRVAEPVKTVRMTEAELAEPKPAPLPQVVAPPPAAEPVETQLMPETAQAPAPAQPVAAAEPPKPVSQTPQDSLAAGGGSPQSSAGAPAPIPRAARIPEPAAAAPPPAPRAKKPHRFYTPVRRAPAAPGPGDEARVIDAVREARFITLPDLLARLSPPVARDAVVAILARHPQVKVFAGPGNPTYQWHQGA